MHSPMARFALLLILAGGCAHPLTVPPAGPDEPANPRAAEAPPPAPIQTLTLPQRATTTVSSAPTAAKGQSSRGMP
jgi:hypothetical protein